LTKEQGTGSTHGHQGHGRRRGAPASPEMGQGSGGEGHHGGQQGRVEPSRPAARQEAAQGQFAALQAARSCGAVAFRSIYRRTRANRESMSIVGVRENNPHT